MYRASTPTHKLRIPIQPELIADLKLTYTQNGKVILEKEKADMTNEGQVWSVTLTQEETNLFSADYALAQVRYLGTDGRSFPSKTFRLYVGAVLNDEVME